MPAQDPNTRAHLEWLGFIQPNGLVVSAPALVKAGAILNRQDAEGQGRLAGCVDQHAVVPGPDPEPCVRDFREFASAVLGWGFSSKGYAGTEEAPVPTDLTVVLPDYSETLRPDFAVRERDPQNGTPPWQLLVQVLDDGQDFDKATTGAGGLEAAPQGRAERLLRGTGVPAGVLFNGVALRLISAPRGESSGWMDFRFVDLVSTAGRPLCSALRLLLSEQRLLALPRDQRLAALLESSRKYQNEVSERLSEQVLHALYELLRGFQAAHDSSGGQLLREPLSEQGDRNDIYRGLLSVILRLVFLLYAEERGMLPEDEHFARYYSLTGLYQRLREDAALNPDTMDQRFGAWAQLLVLFRLIHDGARAHRTGGAVSLPERRGALFDPDRFRFLEGRSGGGVRQTMERVMPPHISDGVVYRVLEKLLVLDGERISYRTLDVEQIGSVYETIMGFRLETATGRSVAIKPAKKLGAPNTIDLDALLAQPDARRGRWLQERADRSITDKVAKGLREAETVDDLHATLDRVLDKDATPDIAPPGALVLQPNEERRRSGSHYTPRELTEPIVRHTLEPLLDRLRSEDGRAATPEQILDLKICDPAMGSGAFLVEACRQLADALIDAWGAHGAMPAIPPDEDEVIYARRLIAQKCLYGIDRNPMAVDLAKVSLWLSTLARDHPLTFMDHAFRHGDSLLGLTRRQIEALHWKRGQPPVLTGFGVQKALEEASALRRQIREADDTVTERRLQNLWRDAQDALIDVRLYGDLVLAAFFEGSKPKGRESRLRAYQEAIVNRESRRHAVELEERRNAEMPFAPFHWEIEFPEVFERENPGFDGFVGNPPFAGKNSVAAGNVAGYPSWLKEVHEESHGNADLVAHFYRRAYNLIRDGGTFGLIATNTIAQGDTRSTGLRWICEHGGEIYHAMKRVSWPGDAAVVVSVIHVAKGGGAVRKVLEGVTVDTITAFLFHRGGNADPVRLSANSSRSFQGTIVLGMGFTFDDTDKKGVALALADMQRLIESNPANREVILPYIGGEEVNASPTHGCHRYVINFGDRSEAECRRRWPDLMAIVEERVKPARMTDNRASYRKHWWQYAEKRRDLYFAIDGLDQILVVNCGAAPHLAVTFLPSRMVFANTLAVFAVDTSAALCAMQSRVHEVWARFFSSSLKDDLRYTPSDCFETFPFPDDWETHPGLEAAGSAYHEYRGMLMVENDEGMTRTYNRFHDIFENDSQTAKLRELHSRMDRAVLDSYGWTDLPVDCDFFLEYEIDEATWGRRKKPYRYRWPDTIRDEVLTRLLTLNAKRAASESALRESVRKSWFAVNKPRTYGDNENTY